jgi:hypothetical protein
MTEQEDKIEKAANDLQEALLCKQTDEALKFCELLGKHFNDFSAACNAIIKALKAKLHNTRILHVATKYSLATCRDTLAFIHG